ncbi:MAG TPA: nitroreductase family deazaflavin-dependent oxidoreductase [Actinomycetota bacterium]|nr:nitroreductase family deazaflavin-dependent oxidoreductase [Actinomycetota bacterium]
MKSPSEARARRRTGPAYEGQKYIPERRFNPFIQNLRGARILSALQLPWYTVMPPRGTGVLTTKGAKTGQFRRKCVRVVVKGKRAYLVAIGGENVAWLKNIRVNPNVRLRIRGGAYSGVARQVQGEAERKEARDAFVETVMPWDYAECNFHRRGRPTREKIQELHGTWFDHGVPVIVDLQR